MWALSGGGRRWTAREFVVRIANALDAFFGGRSLRSGASVALTDLSCPSPWLSSRDLIALFLRRTTSYLPPGARGWPWNSNMENHIPNVNIKSSQQFSSVTLIVQVSPDLSFAVAVVLTLSGLECSGCIGGCSVEAPGASGLCTAVCSIVVAMV